MKTGNMKNFLSKLLEKHAFCERSEQTCKLVYFEPDLPIRRVFGRPFHRQVWKPALRMGAGKKKSFLDSPTFFDWEYCTVRHHRLSCLCHAFCE
jgi:hypothetical protein